jgi:hypothetical protein
MGSVAHAMRCRCWCLLLCARAASGPHALPALPDASHRATCGIPAASGEGMCPCRGLNSRPTLLCQRRDNVIRELGQCDKV